MLQATTNQLTNVTFTVTPEIRRWTEAFLSAKRAEGCSRKTLLAYRQSLDKFLSWCDARNVAAVEALAADDLRQFMLTLVDAGHNAGGQHMFYRVLKTFLRWYGAEVEPAGWRNPIAKVKPPKLSETPLEPAAPETIERLLWAVAAGRQGERDRAVILTLLDTGLRASELTALDLDDLDAATGALLVRCGKGSKSRTVFLGQRSRRAVRAWIKERGTAPGALFVAEAGSRLTYSGLRQIIRRLAERAGVPEPPLHSFRRAFALACLRAGMDLLTLQRLLGHASLALLYRYARQSTDDLRAAHALVSPADRMAA